MTAVIALPGNEPLARALAAAIGTRVVELGARRFPDGESYVRLLGNVAGERILMACTLADPDPQFLRLAFVAGAAREAGAARVELVAPYLAYMRQDRRFADGEAVSARHFARLLSGLFDAVVTIDPHLHRIRALEEVFTVPATALHAAPLLAQWIAENVERPLILGPDVESRQWVEDVALRAMAPWGVLNKVRHGDRDVTIELPDIAPNHGRRPVLVDDIVSSGRTMLQAMGRLREAGFPPPVCVAVHGLFAEESHAALKAAARDVVTTDSVANPAGCISIVPLLSEALRTP